MIGAYHRRLNDPDAAVHMPAARAWAQWEGDTLSVRGPEGRPPKFEEDAFNLAFARIENHYFSNGAFLPSETWILDHIERIRACRAGSCRAGSTWSRPWPPPGACTAHGPRPSSRWSGTRGHASTEPGIVDALVRATDAAYAAA
jgi:proline iminopeptidase